MPTVYSPPVSTYVALATTTLASTTTELTFSNIPSSYRDLIIVANFRMSGVASATRAQFNGDTTSGNYPTVWMVGTGSTAVSSTDGGTSMRIFGQNAGPKTVGQMGIVQIMDYSATDKHKTVLVRYSGADNDITAQAGRWASTNAITTIRLFDSGGQSYQIGDTFSLYGIEA